MKLSNVVYFLAFLGLLTLASCKVHRHDVRWSGGTARRILHGKALGESPLSAGKHKASAKVVSFQAVIKKNVTFWEELANDGIRLDTCDAHGRSRKATATLSGNEIDQADFMNGTVLVIRRKIWESVCDAPLFRMNRKTYTGPVLFLQVTKAVIKSSERRSVTVSLKMVHPRTVMPQVDFQIGSEHIDETFLKKGIAVEDSEDFHTLTEAQRSSIRSTAQNVSLPVTGRFHPPPSEFSVLDDRAKITVDVGVTVSTVSHRFVNGWFSQGVLWDTSVRFQGSVDFEPNTKLASITSRAPLARWEIPGYGATVDGIPGIGSLAIGDFFKVDEVSKLDVVPVGVKVGVHWDFGFSYSTTLQLNLFGGRWLDFHVYNFKEEGTPAPSPSFEWTGSVDSKIEGFSGVRMAIASGTEVDGLAVETSVGADVGLKATAEARLPAFPPKTSGWNLNGPACGTCHYVQGDLKFVGENLSVEETFGHFTRSQTIRQNLFSLGDVSFCAGATSCPTCSRCWSNSDCPNGQVCDPRHLKCSHSVSKGDKCDESRCLMCGYRESCTRGHDNEMRCT